MNIADDLKSAYEDGYEKGFADGFEAGQRDVQPERKKGKWIPVSESGCIIECSACGKRMTALIDDNPSFCCHCGARMER